MFNKNSMRFTILVTCLLTFAGIASAQGPVLGSNTTSAELEMTATVQTAVQLNISQDPGDLPVGGDPNTGLFNVAFGNLNGLGTGTPSAGVVVTPDANGALYTTMIMVTPVYSGFTTETADVTVEAGTSGDEALAREGDMNISASSTVSTTPATVITGSASGFDNDRYVGFYIPRTEPAGAKTATLIYTVTVQ